MEFQMQRILTYLVIWYPTPTHPMTGLCFSICPRTCFCHSPWDQWLSSHWGLTKSWGRPSDSPGPWLGTPPMEVSGPGPGFFVCFLAVSTPEVSWDQLSSAQVYRFRFFCFCVSWAHREQAHKMTGDREQTGKVSQVTWARLSCVIMAPT